MKKIIAVLIVITICCLSFCGCKDNSATKGEEITSANASIMENPIKAKEKIKGESEFLNALSGVWILRGNNSLSGIKKIELKRDYTAIIDGQNGTWDYPIVESFNNGKSSKHYEEQDINNFRIFVDYGNNSEEFKIQKFKTNKNYDKFYTLKNGNDLYVNTSDYNIVEINLQNYREYFEISDYFYPEKDNFGDYIGGIYGVYLCVKDEFDVDGEKSSVEYKYKCTYSTYAFSFNKSTGEHKLLDVIDKFSDVYTPTDKCTNRKDGKYAGAIESREINDVPDYMGKNYKYTVNYPENIEITGIKGKLFIIRNDNNNTK